jgi:hypothetical protein
VVLSYTPDPLIDFFIEKSLIFRLVFAYFVYCYSSDDNYESVSLLLRNEAGWGGRIFPIPK